MLVRGLLGRLTTDVAKTSAHDLPQLSALAFRAAILRYASLYRPRCAATPSSELVNPCSARSYATTPAKSTGAKAKGSATTKQKKSAAGKKAAPKKRATKRKVVVKKKKRVAKRVPSEATKLRLERSKASAKLKSLKAQALLTEPKSKPASAYMVLHMESLQAGEPVATAAKQAGTKYQNLSPLDREHYNRTANENKADNEAAYKAWVETHTPEQIRLANIARAQLRRLRTAKSGKPKETPRAIRDERLVKKVRSPYALYFLERYQTGDFKGIPVSEVSKIIAGEFKSLSPEEKKRFDDLGAADSQRYMEEYERVYGHPAPCAAAKSS